MTWKQRGHGYAVIACGLLLACSEAADDQTRADTTAAREVPALPLIDASATKLPPIDQADASFRAFRETALDALVRRDTVFLYSILTPDIKNSFGGDDSIAGFKRIWRMAEGESAVWSALSRVLRMGGQMAGDSMFIAPYVYALWPDSIDAFQHVAVVSANAPLRAQPSSAAPAAGALSHSIVRLEEWRNLDAFGVATDSTWARVSLPDGRSGWVNGTDVYSPVGWRAFFVKRGGNWLLQLFVAGD